jgi:hypothetical protein
MRKRIRFIGCSIFALVLLFSCKKNTDAPRFHFEYYDMTPGRYVDYEVQEITHASNAAIQHDTNRYFLRTVVEDTIADNQGRIARKYVRYKRMSLTDNWIKTDIWTTLVDNNRAELVEENQRKIKLIFPTVNAKGWNTNAFNSLPKQEVFYAQVHKPLQIGNLFFDSTLVVEIEKNKPNFVAYKRKSEVYAKGVGLVRKSFKDLKIINFDTLNITDGEELFYTVIGYGIQ